VIHVRATRLAIGLFFFGDGLMIGTWAGRIPTVQHHAGLTTARLGLALFAASLGALLAMPVAGRLCERVGSRVITLVGLLLGGGSLLAASLSTGLAGLAAALFAFGVGFGVINVAVNAQGVALEQVAGRSILSSFHAAFSAGGLVGAGTAAVVAAAGVAVQLHYAALFAVLTGFGLVGVRYLLPPEADDQIEERPRRGPFARPPRAILVLGAATFCTMLAEGAAVDWSAVYLSRTFGAAAGVAALAYTAFAFMMMTSRAFGDRLNRRLGPVALARSGGAVATIGLGLALVIGSVPVAIVGFAAMGAGLGVVIPVLFRTAAATSAVSASAGLAAVSTIGWFGFLAGPPAIGFAASAVGLRAALGIVFLATLTLVVLAGNVEPGRRRKPVAAVRWRTDP
jgi:MFS family permease